MSYQLTDEVRASCHGNLAVEEAVRTMVERHEAYHGAAQLHSPLCGTAHGAGTCPLCDVAAKERIAAMTGVQNHTLVVPEWVAELDRLTPPRHFNCRSILSPVLRTEGPERNTHHEGVAVAPAGPSVRRYCPREG